jgi:hypothetical protein
MNNEDKLIRAHAKIEALEHFVEYNCQAVDQYVDYLENCIATYSNGNEDLEDYLETIIDVWEKQNNMKWSRE